MFSDSRRQTERSERIDEPLNLSCINPGKLKFTETACQTRKDKRDSLKLTREQRDSLHERKGGLQKSIYSFPAETGPRTERCPCKILEGRTFWCPYRNFWKVKFSWQIRNCVPLRRTQQQIRNCVRRTRHEHQKYRSPQPLERDPETNCHLI